MKRLMIAAALFVGTAAVAQPAPPSSAPETAPPADTTAPEGSSTAPTDTTAPSDAGAGADSTTQGGMSTQAGLSNGQASGAAPDSYPRCSASVKDRCVQGGKATGRRGRHRG